MSKYLIGVIPSLFLLLIACFARATPAEQFQKPMLHESSAPALLFSSATPLPEKQADIK